MARRSNKKLVLLVALAGCLILVLARVAVAANMEGTNGNDVMHGTPDADLINSKGGNDVIFGKAGPDALYPQWGSDYVYGQAGADSIHLHYDDDRSYDEAYCGDGVNDKVWFWSEDVVHSDCEYGYMCEGSGQCWRHYTPYWGRCDDGRGNNACN